ncbi:transposase, partial [Streptomyces sp. NPDC001774]
DRTRPAPHPQQPPRTPRLPTHGLTQELRSRVVQAFKILRHRTGLKTGRVTRQTIHAVTSMTAREASPQLIGHIARARWGIEAVRHIRDTTFAGDASKIRTGHGPENMAMLATATSPPGSESSPTHSSPARSTFSDYP